MSINFDPIAYPLCAYFFSQYSEKRKDDPKNFPIDQGPDLFGRYEESFRLALEVLKLSKEELRARSEFKFDSGDAGNLESAIALLRAVVVLDRMGFVNIELVKPPGADIICEKDGQKICCEVKAITKQSTARPELFFEEALYVKIVESIDKARTQLLRSVNEHECTLTMYISVVNWFDQSIYLDGRDYLRIANRLDQDERANGIDIMLFIRKHGDVFPFLNERAKLLVSIEQL